MKAEKFNNALNNLDYDLVEEFIREKEAIENKRARRKAIIRLAPVAACFVIFMTVGALLLGFNMGLDKKSEGNLQDPNHITVLFSKEGRFVFEYDGRLYQAYVAPTVSDESLDFAESESVSIQNVGKLLSNVSVMDEKGNISTMEIYSNNNGPGQSEILLKLDSGYFPAIGIDKK